MDQDVALGEADYEDLAEHYVKLEKAAVAGDLNAQYLFAEINENWKAGYHNYTKTMHWYKKAALNGHVLAQNRLGYMHRWRVFVDTDFHEAIKWYTMAARQGHVESMNSLGHMYDHAEDFYEPMDYVPAYMWFTIAIEYGSKTAARNRDRITKYMKPAQVRAAQGQTKAWLQQYKTAQATTEPPATQLDYSSNQRHPLLAALRVGGRTQTPFPSKGVHLLYQNDRQAHQRHHSYCEQHVPERGIL